MKVRRSIDPLWRCGSVNCFSVILHTNTTSLEQQEWIGVSQYSHVLRHTDIPNQQPYHLLTCCYHTRPIRLPCYGHPALSRVPHQDPQCNEGCVHPLLVPHAVRLEQGLAATQDVSMQWACMLIRLWTRTEVVWCTGHSFTLFGLGRDGTSGDLCQVLWTLPQC